MHDDIYDHDHPDNFVIKEDEIVTDIEGLEMFSLKSVGIDIDFPSDFFTDYAAT